MPTWTIDPDHSVAAFSVRHLMLANVRGQFNKVKGSIQFDPSGPGKLSVEADIDVASIWTGIAKRDDHLRSSDFFDVEKYPKMRFKSKTVSMGSGKQCAVHGDLTIRGITRPVVLNGEYSGPIKLPDDLGGETSIGFSGSLVINREDFGIMWGSDVPIGNGLFLSREVGIFIDLEADRSSD